MPESTPYDWNDFTFRQYLVGLEGELRELCLSWMQKCRFSKRLPLEFHFFQDRLAVLGIDRLGLDSDTTRMLLEAISDKGASIPGTSLVLRVARPWWAIFGPASGGEPMLPNHWLAGVEVGDDEQRLWIGKRVIEWPLCPAPPDDAEQIQAKARLEFDNFDWSLYQEYKLGWKLSGTPPLPDVLFDYRSE